VTAVPPTRTLDLATFTPPSGWDVEQKGGAGSHVVISHADPAGYCMFIVYPSTPADRDLESSFAAEWRRVALATIDPVATQAPAISVVGDNRIAIGGAPSTCQGRPVVGLLMVFDAGSHVLSVLVLSPSFEDLQRYRADLDAFVATFVVRRETPPLPVPGAPNLEPPRPTTPVRALTVADLAGEWGRNDGINTRYVDAHTGAYAGTDSIHFTEHWSITSEGTIALDFFGIHNGRRIVEKSTAAVTLSGTILTIHTPNQQRFVLRGWEDTPAMTVMTLNGAWYEGGIPPEILANPAYGVNLDQRWVRLRKA
jgi:hypothetical protein